MDSSRRRLSPASHWSLIPVPVTLRLDQSATAGRSIAAATCRHEDPLPHHPPIPAKHLLPPPTCLQSSFQVFSWLLRASS